MNNNWQRNKKFLTKAEYASYLESMKQHATAAGPEGRQDRAGEEIDLHAI
jgi:hypothetical protein